MTRSPHFSIIMPLYNKAPYVRKAVESIVGQTYGDWELIVIDNGSTDGSDEIVAGITDSRIRIIRLKENIGPGGARNHGVSESTAPWICFLDADDWWEPTFLEEMTRLTERHPDAGIYGTNYYIVKNGRKRVAPIGVDEDFTEGEINYCKVYAKTLCMPLTSITVCMPRAIFDDAGGFPTDIHLGEDFLLWIHIALKHKVFFLNKPLSNYNQDVDVTFRGTHHLRNPKEHMLWNLEKIDTIAQGNTDYNILKDKLIISSMLPYLAQRKRASDAHNILKNIDWRNATTKERIILNLPQPAIYLYYHYLRTGSRIKQFILKHIRI